MLRLGGRQFTRLPGYNPDEKERNSCVDDNVAKIASLATDLRKSQYRTKRVSITIYLRIDEL